MENCIITDTIVSSSILPQKIINNRLRQEHHRINSYGKISMSYVYEFAKELERMQYDEVERACDLIMETFLRGAVLYVAGNGGSAAASNHFYADLSNELIVNPAKNMPKVVSLCDSIVRLTAIANDFGYENVFSRQLDNVKEEDTLLLLSVSGESENLVNAAMKAKKQGANVIAVVSKESTLSKLSNVSIIFGQKDYGISEDFQTMFLHMIKRKLNKNKPHKCQ